MALTDSPRMAAFMLFQFGNVGRDEDDLLTHKPTESQLQEAVRVAHSQVDLALHTMRKHHGMPEPSDG